MCIELFCNKENMPALRSSVSLKGPALWLYRWFVRRHIRNATWGHGIGRHSVEEVWSIAQNDIEALGNFLGK
jgi:hypothetical protein